MPYFARLWGYSYDRGVEKKDACYLDKQGRCTKDRSLAMVYQSEADAWEHLCLIGEEQEAWVEEIEK